MGFAKKTRLSLVICSSTAALIVPQMCAAQQAPAPANAASPASTQPVPAPAQAASGNAAQPQANAPVTNTSDDIVVTAERRETNIMAVPMAMQAFTGKRLNDLRVTNVASLTQIAPSFSVSRSYQGTPQFAIRGIAFNAVNMTSSPTVTVNIDEVAYPYPYMLNNPLFDMQQVEVLKGPQGTLYGRNTTAGAINFTTARPTKTFTGGLTVEAGNYDTFNAEGYLSGPLTDNLQVRLSARKEDSYQGWQISNTRPDDRLGEVHNYGGRFALAWQPAPNLSVDLTASAWLNKSDAIAGQGFALVPSIAYPSTSSQTALANDPALQKYFNQYPRRDAEHADWTPTATRSATVDDGLGLPGHLGEDSRFYNASLRIKYDLSDNLHLASVTGYSDLRRRSLQDESGVPYEILIQQLTGSIKSFSQELRLSGDSGAFDWTAGVYYGKDTMHESIRGNIGDNANRRAVTSFLNFIVGSLFSPYTGSAQYPTSASYGTGSTAFRNLLDEADIDVNTKSVFGNVDFKIDPTLTLTLGARYTQDQLHSAGCTRDVNGNTIRGVNATVAYLIDSSSDGALVPPDPAQVGGCVTTNFDVTPTYRGVVTSQTNQDNLALRAALNWRPAPGLMFYASATQGAKSGVVPINTANSFDQDAPVKQEILRAYEIGGRADLSSWARFSLGGFYYDYKDKQVSGYFRDIVFTTLARLINIPKSRAYGAEAELTLTPVRGVTLTGSANYLNTRVNGYVGVSEFGPDVSFDGSAFPYAPKWAASGTVVIDRPMNETLNFIGTLNYRWQSSSNAGLIGHFDPTDPTYPYSIQGEQNYAIPAYGVLNASLGVHTERYSISVWAKNLGDTYYPVSINTNANVVFEIPGMPRTFGATFSAKF